MKRMFFLATIVLSLLMTACITEIPSKPLEQSILSDSPDNTLAMAEEYMNWMLEGEYQKAFDVSSDELKELFVSVQNLELMMKQISTQLGELLESGGPVIGPEITEYGIGYTFPLVYEAGRYNMNILVQFDKIGSFSLVSEYAMLPNQNELAKQSGPVPSSDLPAGVAEKDIIVNKGEDFELYGKLTYPENVSGDIPAVVLVHGSGNHDMDETIGPNKPLKDIAYALSMKGIAVLRYNKVTYAYPENAGEFSLTVDMETVNDAVSAKTALVEQSGMTFSKIYVAGHSLGGMMAPRITKLGNYDGMILLAGSARGLDEILFDQGQYLLPLLGLTDEQLSEQLALYETLREESLEIMKLPESELSDKTIFGLPATYILSISNPPAAQDIKDLDIPTLILQGSKDFQIYPDKDFVLYEEVTEGLSDVTMNLYDGLNHMFMPSFMEQPDTMEYNAPANVDPEVLNDMAEWILERQ